MSLRGGNNLVIKAFDDEHLTWWVEAGQVVIRIVSLAPIGIDAPPETLTVTDSDGNVVPRPKPRRSCGMRASGTSGCRRRRTTSSTHTGTLTSPSNLCSVASHRR